MTDVSEDADWFAARFDVSRGTLRRLEIYADLLRRWNAKINLISRADETALWRRHFADFMQLFALAGDGSDHWVDLGSGAGFPGLVLAANAFDRAGDTRFTLVESDQRKAVFLAEAARAMSIRVAIHASRIEALTPLRADVLTARALAPLTVLLDYQRKHAKPDGIALFPKGRTVHKEIEDAALKWRFVHRLHPSVTDDRSAIVEVRTVTSV